MKRSDPLNVVRTLSLTIHFILFYHFYHLYTAECYKNKGLLVLISVLEVEFLDDNLDVGPGD